MAGAGGIGSGEAAAAGAGPRSGGGGGSRRGGGGGGRGEEWTAEDQAALALKQQIAEARLNATADNRNADQIYSRQEAAAKRENIERDLLAKRDDGITIPSPPRTGVTEFHYGQSTPGPRNDVMGLPDVVAREKELAKAEADAAKRKAAVAGGSNDIIQTILDYELLHMGFKAATAQQESLFRGAKAFGIDPTSEEGRKSMVLLDMASRDAAANTSYKRTQTAEGISLLAGPFGLTGPEGVKTFAGIYPGAARAAEGLELIDPANHFKETLPAMMGYMHASRQYEADKLPHTYDLLGIITGLIPHTTFAAEAKAMAYVAPLARAAGIPADEVAMDVGILQQAGLGGTIGATTLRQELVGLTRGGEQMPKTRHSHMLAHETKEFENALKMQGDEGRAINEATKGNAHMRAMTEIGLFDAQGHRTFLYKPGNIEGGDVGGVDLNEANRILQTGLAMAGPDARGNS